MTINNRNIHAVILAAGQGKRMKSDLPKVLHHVSGKPMIEQVLESAKKAGISDITVVVGFRKEKVEEIVKKWVSSNSEITINFAFQEEQNGTGHAIMCAKEFLPNENSDILVLLGDVPFITPETISDSIKQLNDESASMLIMSMKPADPSGYGRIIRDNNGLVKKICEDKDATDEEKAVTEVNTGTFVYRAEDLWSSLSKINCDNAQAEYYLTDTAAVLVSENKKVIAKISQDAFEFTGINSQEQLKEIEEKMAAIQ